jgi:hypothetical protein
VYHFGDIYATKLSKDGKLVWMNKIPKHQTGTRNPGGLSFNAIPFGNKLVLFYLDNNKNMDLPDDKDPAVHSDKHGGMFVAATFDEKGKYKRDVLFDLRDEKMISMHISEFIPFTKNTLLGEVYGKKNQNKPLLISVE